MNKEILVIDMMLLILVILVWYIKFGVKLQLKARLKNE